MVFISEIVLQSKIAQRAAERLEAAHNHFDHVEVWGAIQSGRKRFQNTLAKQEI